MCLSMWASGSCPRDIILSMFVYIWANAWWDWEVGCCHSERVQNTNTREAASESEAASCPTACKLINTIIWLWIISHQANVLAVSTHTHWPVCHSRWDTNRSFGNHKLLALSLLRANMLFDHGVNWEMVDYNFKLMSGWSALKKHDIKRKNGVW